MKFTIEVSNLEELGKIMATLKEAYEAAKAEKDAVLAAINMIKNLADEVERLKAANDDEGLQALIDQTKENAAALVAATMMNTPIEDVVTMDDIQAASDSVEHSNAPIDGSAIV